jgi:SAM-dependent methyltransferase
MNKVRPYVPLFGFVVPTVVIGYGFVIPRSCIAGVNELTIGFATTIIGAVLTYIAGQRAVMPRGVCTKPPLRIRIARAINRQSSSPSGLLGRLLGFIWPREHRRLNAEVLDEADIQMGHRVLEIGSGPGHTLREAARRTIGGHATGVDISELMGTLARRRNRASVARGEVDIRVGDIASLDLNGATFDRIFSVNCIYFWRDVDGVLAKVAAALNPHGKLVLAFRPASDDIPARFRDPIYRFPHERDVRESLRRAGLTVASARRSKANPNILLVTATR